MVFKYPSSVVDTMYEKDNAALINIFTVTMGDWITVYDMKGVTLSDELTQN